MTLENFGLRVHWNLSNEGIRVDAGTIVAPGNILHGKELARIVRTRKNKNGWGKGVVVFCLNEDNSPEFPTIEEFKKYYNISD